MLVTMSIANFHFLYDFEGFSSRRVGYICVGDFDDPDLIKPLMCLGDTLNERIKAETCFLRSYKLNNSEFLWVESPEGYQGIPVSKLERMFHNLRVLQVFDRLSNILYSDCQNYRMTPHEYLRRMVRLIAETKAALR